MDRRIDVSLEDKKQSKVSSAGLSIVSYCLASIAMTVINKYIVSGRGFDMNFLLLAIQSIVSISLVSALKGLNVINFRDFNWTDTKAWFPVSFLLAVVIYTGSKSLQYLQIPVYTIFKNLTIILIAYGETIWFGGSISRLAFLSFLLMVLSSLVAASEDILNAFSSLEPSGSATGYCWMFTNCISSAAYLLVMRKRIKVTAFKDWDSMAYNNALSVPLLVVASLIREDWSAASLDRNFPESNRYLLLSTIAFSGAAAVGISYTTAWCVRTTSSTTYSMVGALNKLPVAASGLIFFNDPATPTSISAIAIGFVAGIMYTIAKQNQTRIGAQKTSSYIPLTSNANK